MMLLYRTQGARGARNMTGKIGDVGLSESMLVFVVNSFTGETFDRIANATCRIVDETTGEEAARYDLSGAGGSHTAQVMAKVSRSGAGWTMTAIGEIASGRTFIDLMPTIKRSL